MAAFVAFAIAGFTPAYAGNTVPVSFYFAVYEVHPRIRGEYYSYIENKIDRLVLCNA